jgi:hypothetical protein
MPLPRNQPIVITLPSYSRWNVFCIAVVTRLRRRSHHEAATVQRRKTLKIYLLMVLIGALLTAIHFTSAPEQQSKTLPQ